jgi:hypothetical protein
MNDERRLMTPLFIVGLDATKGPATKSTHNFHGHKRLCKLHPREITSQKLKVSQSSFI